MNDNPKKIQTTPQEKNNKRSDVNHFSKLVEIIQILHEHLPDEIPEVELVSASRSTISVNRNATLSITGSGKSLKVTLPEEMPDEIHDVLLLFRFLSKYREDTRMNLWISGLPWGFNGEEFYRTYVKELGHKITTEMLSKIGFDKGACERYKSKYKDIIKKSRFEIFQDQIVEYRKNQKYNSFKLDFILKELNSDVTLSEINEWQQQTLFKKTITIDFKKNKIWIWSE